MAKIIIRGVAAGIFFAATGILDGASELEQWLAIGSFVFVVSELE